MGILSNLLNKGQKNQAVGPMLELMKRGKRPEQCKCIDYLYTPDEDVAKGLFGKKKSGKK